MHGNDVLDLSQGSNSVKQARATRRAVPLTVANALMGIVLVLAAIARFVSLDALPLSSAESAQAIAAYDFATRRMAAINIGSPAWFSLTSLTQLLIGSGDAAMRIVPALFGLATTALPWFLRNRLGTVGALVTSLLLAVSPIHAAFGRTVSGDSIALFAGLLLFPALMGDWPAPRRWLLLVVAAAIGLASAPLFFSITLTIALTALIQRGLGNFDAPERPDADVMRRLLATGAVLFVALTTMLFLVPSGIGAAADIAGRWVSQFGMGQELLVQSRGLIAYEPILLLGLPALVIVIGKLKNSFYSFLFVWSLTSIMLMLVQAGQIETLALLTLPIYLMLGRLVQDAISTRLRWESGLITLALSLWGFVTLVNIGRFTRLSPNPAPLLVSLLILCALALLIMLYIPERALIMPGVLFSLLAIWSFYGWGVGWSLTHEWGNDPREPIAAVGTDSDVRLLRDTIQEASYQFSGSNQALDIMSSIDTPVIRWYLRDFEAVEYVVSIPPGTQTAAVIAPEMQTPALNGNYGFATFDYLLEASGDNRPGDTISTLRWLFFRDSAETVEKEKVTLWLKLNSNSE